MLGAGLLTLLSAPVCGAHASSVTVSPILIDGGSASEATITLRNQEARPLNAQIRVFRWQQDGGEDRLTPTDDIVASPPIVTIRPDEDYVVRLERVAGGDAGPEQAYRVVVDELPDPNRQRNGTVAVVLRYLVPAFFFSPDASQPRVSWSMGRRNGRMALIATNRGDKRLQVVDLKMKLGGRQMLVAKGLAGYVLGHSNGSGRSNPG